MSNPFDEFDAPQGNPFDEFGHSDGTRLYSPNPNAPTVYGAPSGEYQNGQRIGPVRSEYYDAKPDPLEMYRRFAGGVTDNFVRGATFLPDLALNAGRYFGAIPQGPTLGDLGHRALFGDNQPQPPPANMWEAVAGDVGNATGDVASTVLMGKAVGSRFKGRAPSVPAGTPVYASAPTTPLPKFVADSFAAQPVAQGALTTAGNVAGTLTGDPNVAGLVSTGLPTVAGLGQRTFQARPAETTQEAERRALLQYGRDNGLGPLTASKILGSGWMQTLDSAASKLPLPFLSSRINKIEETARNAYQGKALEKAGTYGKTAATADTLADTAATIGPKFDAFHPYTLTVDPQLDPAIATVEKKYSKQFLAAMEPGLMDRIDELRAGTKAASPQNPYSIDGETFQNLRSDLSELSAKGGKTGRAAGALVGALDDWAERQLPSDVVGDYRIARQEWRNYLALKKGVSANNDQAVLGNLSTAAYAKAARGNPDIARLGQYGAAFIGDKAGNTSKTAVHNKAMDMLTGGLGGMVGAGGTEAGIHGLVDPKYLMAAAGTAAIPYAFHYAMNNPAMRALLLSRYQKAAPAWVKPSLVGATAFDALKGQ